MIFDDGHPAPEFDGAGTELDSVSLISLRDMLDGGR